MRKFGVLLVVCLLMFSFFLVLAQDDDNESRIDDDNGEENESRVDDDNYGVEDGMGIKGNSSSGFEIKRALRERIRNTTSALKEDYKADIDELRIVYKDDLFELRDVAQELVSTLNNSNLTRDEKQKILDELRSLGQERRKVGVEYKDEVRGIRVEYRNELKNFLNETKVDYKLRDGRNFSVKIMPEVASERAIERLGLKVCNESNGCSIGFKEVGVENKTRLFYSLKAEKEGRFLGLFKTKMGVTSDVDAETGEVVRMKKPWWAFLVR